MIEASLLSLPGFLIFLLAVLVIDLGVFNRRAHAQSTKEALIWSLVWIALAFIYCGILYHKLGPDPATDFITGYLIEKSLSADNLFVFVLIFAYFKVPLQLKHRVLFWGIIISLALRGLLILAGTELVKEFHWVIYIFGTFLIYTGIKVATSDTDGIEPEKNPVVRMFRRIYPISDDFVGTKFFVFREGHFWATPLFLVILMVGTTDVIFAVDSIPAIFAITLDPFIVFTANAFAVMGPRSLYFLLANIVSKFHYLKYGLSVILVYVGGKMLMSSVYKIPTLLSLMFILGVLTVAIVASLARDRRLPKD